MYSESYHIITWIWLIVCGNIVDMTDCLWKYRLSSIYVVIKPISIVKSFDNLNLVSTE